VKGLFILLIFAAAIITAGCSGLWSGSSESAPVVISSEGDPGWIPYSNADNHFSLYKPADWDVMSVTKTTVAKKTTMDLTHAMERFVFICTPDTTVCVMVFGMEYTDEYGPLYTDSQQTKITDAMYRGYLQNLRSASFEGGKVSINGTEEDSRFYLINGNPARFASITVQAYGNTRPSDGYIIAHGNSYYSASYAARTNSREPDIETAAKILRTFDVTE